MCAKPPKDISLATQKPAKASLLAASAHSVGQNPSRLLSPEADIGHLELAEIIDVEMMQSLLEHFYELAHMPMAILDDKGKVLVAVGWQGICTRFHRIHPATCKNCRESDLQLTAGIPAGEFRLYRCKNNMWDVATPIMVGDRRFGNLFSGQFVLEDEPLDYDVFRAQAKQHGFNEAEYMAAVEALPRLNREAVNRGMAFLMKLAYMLSQMGYNNLKLARSLAEREHDITERVITEQALRKSEERFRAMANAIPNIVWTADVSGCIDYFNDWWYQYTGLTPEQSLGPRNFLNVLHPADVERTTQSRLKCFSTGDQYEGDYRVRRASDGSYRWHLVRGVPIRDSEGRLVRWFGTCTDIEDLKQAQALAGEQGELFRTLFDTIPLSAALIDQDTLAFMQFNDAAARDLGYTREEFAKLTVNDIEAAHPPQEIQLLAEQLRPGQLTVLETKHRTKSGSIRDVVVYLHLMTIDGRRLGNCVWEDVTEKKAAEAALIRSEKLASVGRMAATVAHEINNPLAAVMNTLYLARASADEPESVRRYLDTADDEVKRIAHITRQTLGFYHESSAPTIVSVASIMDSAVDILRGKIKVKRAIIEKQYDQDIQVTAVSGELRQVFSNLLANSLDAVAEKGTIKLRVSRSACVNHGRPGVRVTVADDGSGITAATRPRIFEPLFTTKEATGSGLGLWVSKQIIEKHGGSIRVRSSTSSSRRGTVFSVVLPLNAELARALAT